MYVANNNQNKAGVTELKPDNVDFKTRIITMGKEVYFIMIKGLILQEYIIILNVYTYSNRASKYMKQKLKEQLKGKEKPTITIETKNSSLSN